MFGMTLTQRPDAVSLAHARHVKRASMLGASPRQLCSEFAVNSKIVVARPRKLLI